MLTPPCSAASRTKTGQPNGWKYSSFVLCFTLANFSSADVPPFSLALFAISHSFFRAKGQRLEDAASGHHCIACRRLVLAPSHRSLILFSAIPFWWWAPTPQKVSSWCCSAQSLRQVLSAKRPLSALYPLTLTPNVCVNCSYASFAAIVCSPSRLVIRWT